MKIKILFVHQGIGIGGAFISLLNLVESLNKEKYDITVLFVKYQKGAEYFIKRGIKSYYVSNKFYENFYMYYQHFQTFYVKWYKPHLFIRQFLSWFLNAFYFAPKELRKFDFDILYLNSSVLSDWAFAIRKMKKKTIIHLRETFSNGYFGFRKMLIKKSIISNSDFIISISQFNANALGLKDNYKVIYNYADNRFFDKLVIRDFNSSRLLYVGGYSYIKGFITIVNSINYLTKGDDFIFAGYYPKYYVENGLKKKIKYLFPPYNKMKKALIKLGQTDKNVEVIGIQDNIYEVYKKADILVSPFSKPHFSRPIIEAFAMGLIVISSNVDGINEIINDGINGFLFKKDNPQDLAKTIEKVNNLTFNVKKNIINNARITAERFFTSKNILKIEQILDQTQDYNEK